MPGPCLRCSTCGIDWPMDRERYETCPGCEGQTDGLTSGNPGDRAEAWSTALHLMFDRYYADREASQLRAELDTVPVFSD